MVSRLDLNQDGVITASELEQANGFVKGMLQQQTSLDFNRGVKVEDLQPIIQKGMEDMRANGGFGGRGGPGGGRGRDGEPPATPEAAPASTPAIGTPAIPSYTPSALIGTLPGSTRSRISPLIPETFKSLDGNFDGQVSLSEWRKAKRGTISEFAKYDANGDGFLVPKELAKMSAIAAPAPGVPGATPATATAVASAPAAPLAPVSVSAEASVKAIKDFGLLDDDKNGTVAGSEWDKSRRLKPLFEKGGYDLAKPLNKDDFVQAYVRVGADK